MLVNEEGNPSEVVEEVVVDETKSMDDTILNTLRGIKERTPEEVTPAPVDDVEKAAQLRDDKGKFAAETKPPVVSEEKTEPVTPMAKPAPNTWRKEVADKWSALPPEVQSEVERREADFHKGIEQYKSKAQIADNFEKAIAPYMATIQSLGVAPEQAASALMAADHKLRYGSPAEKSMYFAQLANSYGIDLAQVQPTQNQQIDPNVAYFQQKIAALEQQVQQQSQIGKQMEDASLNSEVSQFAADPSHRHFESVKADMARLLQAGAAETLKDAYEQAIWINPASRAAMIAEQQASVKEEANQKAQAAKAAASVNVKARPSMPVSAPIGNMDDTILRTLRRLQNA